MKKLFKIAYGKVRSGASSSIVGFQLYWNAQECLYARDTYKHIDLYCPELVGRYKRYVFGPKGKLP